MTSSCSSCLWKFINTPRFLFVLFIISIILCILIETDSGFILCKSKTLAKTTNKIMLTISYGYIASSVFHFFVNVSPRKYEKYLMEGWVRKILCTIREDLRLTKALVINPFSFQGEPNDKESYLKIFCNFNFEETPAPFNNRVTAIEKLNEYRHILNNNISLLLHFRGFLSEEQTEFVAYVAKSNFLTDFLRPHRDGCSFYNSNQEQIGSSIYDLYEKAKIYIPMKDDIN